MMRFVKRTETLIQRIIGKLSAYPPPSASVVLPIPADSYAVVLAYSPFILLFEVEEAFYLGFSSLGHCDCYTQPSIRDRSLKERRHEIYANRRRHSS